MLTKQPHKQFMKLAIDQAKHACTNGDYAIGAVIVKDNKVIAIASNKVRIQEDATCHAEMIAIRKAAKLLNSRHLLGCILYTTNEPCPMCTSASVWAKLDGIVWGTRMEDMT